MVEIKIDTTKSSKQDIRRAIEFLKNYVDESPSNNNSSNDIDISPGAMDIFSQDEPTVQPNNIIKDEPEEKSDSDIKIKPIFY